MRRGILFKSASKALTKRSCLRVATGLYLRVTKTQLLELKKRVDKALRGM